jgi:hypothetical protein
MIVHLCTSVIAPRRAQILLCAFSGDAPEHKLPHVPQDGNDDDEAGPSGGGGGDDAFAGSDEGEDPLAGLSSDDDADGEDIPNVVLAQFEKAGLTRANCRENCSWAGM